MHVFFIGPRGLEAIIQSYYIGHFPFDRLCLLTFCYALLSESRLSFPR
jgi:hypothetical protein